MAKFKVPDRSTEVRWKGAVEGLVPDGHPVRFVWEHLSALDFDRLEALYPAVQGRPGRPPYHPRLLTALWVYGMTVGLETAVEIAEACRLRDDFKWLAGGLSPSDQTLLNFLSRALEELPSIWIQVLQAMDRAGLIDLSVIIEDGTKLRANASPDSFLGLSEIGARIKKLEETLKKRIEKAAEAGASDSPRRTATRIAGAKAKLARAVCAEEELRARIERRDTRSSRPVPVVRQGQAAAKESRFGVDKFRRHAERDVLTCPANEELRLIGEYPTENGQRKYRLYGRSNCTGCPLKEECTGSKGRRVKWLEEPAKEAAKPPPVISAPVSAPATEPPSPIGTATPATSEDGANARGPVASLTDPHSLMMLATSKKRWEPSFNADIAITRDGIIVSQFLTKDPTDYHHFSPALGFVISTLRRPQSWVGDGHYGTAENILLATRSGVELYAPRPGSQKSDDDESAPKQSATEPRAARPDALFTRADFRADPEHDVLVCPAGNELRFMGEYSDSPGTLYRLYGRRDCAPCSLKERCTRSGGRRVKVPATPPPAVPASGTGDPANTPTVSTPAADDLVAMLRAHEDRMRERGDQFVKLRGQTIEPVNGQIKQHGIGRFHVRGLPRCGTVLTLACIGHNMMKWRTRAMAPGNQPAHPTPTPTPTPGEEVTAA